MSKSPDELLERASSLVSELAKILAGRRPGRDEVQFLQFEVRAWRDRYREFLHDENENNK